MKLFSQRKGLIKAKDFIQKESMNEDLKIGIWNTLKLFVWDSFEGRHLNEDQKFYIFFQFLWMDFFKYPVDTLDNYWDTTYKKIRETFFDFKWFEVYDFIEYIANDYPGYSVDAFISMCNNKLEKELSAYRFVGKIITEITSSEEIQEIEKAMADSPTPVRQHLHNALRLLGDKKAPDYRNSIKESISAIESMCKKVSGDRKATLGKALSLIEQGGKVNLHPALKEAFSKLYGYTNDVDGIRHALIEEDKLDFEDAKFILVSSSAFLNYLIVKADKSGVSF